VNLVLISPEFELLGVQITPSYCHDPASVSSVTSRNGSVTPRNASVTFRTLRIVQLAHSVG